MRTPDLEGKLETISSTTTTPPSGLYAADRAVNLSGMIMISQSTMGILLSSNIQTP